MGAGGDSQPGPGHLQHHGPIVGRRGWGRHVDERALGAEEEQAEEEVEPQGGSQQDPEHGSVALQSIQDEAAAVAHALRSGFLRIQASVREGKGVHGERQTPDSGGACASAPDRSRVKPLEGGVDGRILASTVWEDRNIRGRTVVARRDTIAFDRHAETAEAWR